MKCWNRLYGKSIELDCICVKKADNWCSWCSLSHSEVYVHVQSIKLHFKLHWLWVRSQMTTMKPHQPCHRVITKVREESHPFETTHAKQDCQTSMFSETVQIIKSYWNAITMIWVNAFKYLFFLYVLYCQANIAPVQLPYILLALQIVLWGCKQWLCSARSWSGSEAKTMNYGRKG